MKLLTKIVSAASLTASLAFGAIMPASASVTPAVYTSGWSQTAVKPSWIRLGAGGNVEAHTWYWNTWNSTTAKSTGTLWINKCVPDCAAGHYSYHKLQVILSDVKTHNGRAYFSEMSWYTPGYHLDGYASGTTAVMYYVTTVGTIPWWTGCSPLTSKDTCYEPGEYCPGADHDMKGLAGDGKAIACRNENGWRWVA